MDNIQVDVDFVINNPELKAAAERAKATISGVGVSADQVAQRAELNTQKALGQQTALIGNLQKKLEEAKTLAKSATNETTIELANAKIQDYQRQIQRLAVIGKQGFDDLGNKIVDAVEKPIGRLQKLQYLAKAYGNMAATSDNADIITKYNKKLQDTQIEIGRVQNVGKKGFDDLGNKIIGGTGLISKMWGGLRMLAMALPGIGIAGLLAFSVEPILTYLSTLDIFKKKLTDLERVSEQMQKSLEGGGEYAKAVASVTELQIHLAMVEKGTYSSKAAIDEYNNSIGTVAGQVTKLDEAERKTADNAEFYVKMILYKAAAHKVLEEAASKAAEAEKERFKTDEESLPLVNKLQRALTAGSFSDRKYLELANVKAAKVAKQSAIDDLNKEKDSLEKIANSLLDKASKEAEKMGGILGNDKSQKNQKTAMDKSVENAEALQRKIFDIQDEYSRKSKDKDEAELQEVRDRFEKISSEVVKFNKNPKNKIKVDGSGLIATRDNAIADLTYKQETEKMKIGLEEQKKLFEEYEEYKKTFGEERAKERYGKEIDVAKAYQVKLQDLEAEYLSLKGKSGLSGGETDRMKAVKKFLDEAKLAQLKTDDAVFKEALDASQTYFDMLEKIELDYLTKTKSLKKNGELSGGRQAELDEAKKVAIDAAKDEALQKTAIYKRLSIELLDYTRKQITEQIGLTRSLLQNENLSTELRTSLEEQLQGLELRLKFGVDATNLVDLKMRFKDLTTELNSTDVNGLSIVSEKERRRILLALAEIQAKIKAIDANGNGKAGWGDKVAKQFEYLKGDAEEVTKGLSQDLGRISAGFENMAQQVGGVNTELGGMLMAMSSATKLGSELAGTVASFASGDVIGGVMGVLNIVGSVIASIGAADKAYNDFYQNAVDGERKYQDALRERALLNAKIDKTQLDAAAAQLKVTKANIEAMKKEAAEILKQLQGRQYVKELEKFTPFLSFTSQTRPVFDTLTGKSFEQLKELLLSGKLEGTTKTLVERLVELEQKGYDAEQAMRDLAQTISELFTGTTADNLTNSLVQMFQEGKTSAQDFADFFEKTMQDAALSIFKNKVLAESMDKFYKEFSKQVTDGTLSSSEIADLKKLFESLTSDASKQFDALKAITGLGNLGSGSSGSSGGLISGAIQRTITEQTGSELAGLYRNMYDLNKRQLDVSSNSFAVLKEQLLSQKAIESNTANTVEQLKLAILQLRTINRNTYSANRGYDAGF